MKRQIRWIALNALLSGELTGSNDDDDENDGKAKGETIIRIVVTLLNKVKLIVLNRVLRQEGIASYCITPLLQ